MTSAGVPTARGFKFLNFLYFILFYVPREGGQVEFAGVPSARGVITVPRACLHVHEALFFLFFLNFLIFLHLSRRCSYMRFHEALCVFLLNYLFLHVAPSPYRACVGESMSGT